MSNTATIEKKKDPAGTNPGFDRLVDDVKTIGHELKSHAADTKESIVSNAKVLASDTKEVAQAKYIAAKDQLREKSQELHAATDVKLEQTRERIAAQPLQALAIAAGVGFFLGRFIFNGR